MTGKPWFEGGLHFACTRCGHCCSGSHGVVSISDEEIGALARHVDVEESEFRVMYTRDLRRGAVSLREKHNGDCVFFDRRRGCTVYTARPRQCRTWPFWGAVVHSPERWDEEARECPGMNSGPRHAPEVIRASADDDGTDASRQRAR